MTGVLQEHDKVPFITNAALRHNTPQDRSDQQSYLPTAQTKGLSQADSPDIGDQQDMRVKAMPRFLPENREQNITAVVQSRALAEKKGCSVDQLALAWVLKQGG